MLKFALHTIVTSTAVVSGKFSKSYKMYKLLWKVCKRTNVLSFPLNNSDPNDAQQNIRILREAESEQTVESQIKTFFPIN